MGDYNQNQQYPQPPPTPTPQTGGGFSIWDILGPVLRAVLPPQVSGFGDQMMNVYHMAGNNAIRSYANLAQDPAVNAMMYGQWPQGAPANPWPTVPALPPGAAPGSAGLTDADRNRLQIQGPSPALGGYQPLNRPGPGMPPRVLTFEDTKTQLNQAEAEAWRRYNAGGAGTTSNIPPYAPPVIGPPGHYLYLTQHQDSKGQWVNSYGPRAPVAQTGDVAGATNPLAHPDTHGAGPPLPGDQGRPQGGPPPPPTNQGGAPQGRGLAGKGFEWKTGDGVVHSGIVGTDGMRITSPDGASGVVAMNPDGSYSVIESTPQQANNTPTTTNPTTTSTPTTTNPPRTLQSTSTSQPPRMLSSTTSTLPPSSGAGGAVAAPGAQPGASSPPSSPDMQLLDKVPMPPTAATTQTPTTTQAPTTAPPTSTTQTPTTTQPPPTSAFPLGPTTTTPPTLPPGVTPPVTNFPLGPNPPRPEQGAGTSAFPLGPGQGARTGSPSPAFQPPGERAGLAVGQAVGTAPGAETQPQPSILSRAAAALGPAEAAAGGPPGGPGAAPAAAPTETQPVPEETPSEPTTVLQPSQQRSADIAQAIARNTNGIQNYIRKTYPQYPKMFDIPPAIKENDGVLIDAGDAVARSRAADMAAARAQATPERRAQLDAANNAYNRLWLLYRTPIGAKGYTGLDASLPTADKPGFNRGILESGNFFKELSQGGGPAKWVGDFGHAMSRSGAGIPNAPGSLESVEQMAGRGGEEGQAATNFLQGHTVAIPIARALGASGRVNQRELALIQQYLIPSPDTLYEGNFQKLQNTLDTLDAVRRGYAVDPGKTGMVLMTGPDGVPHLVEQGGGTGPNEGGPQIAVPGPIGGNQSVQPQQGRMIGR